MRAVSSTSDRILVETALLFDNTYELRKQPNSVRQTYKDVSPPS